MDLILRTKLIIYYLTVTLAVSGTLFGCHKGEREYNDNQAFLNKASSSSTLKIAAGNLAVQKGQEDNVQDYGEEIVKEHSDTAEEMKELAVANNWIFPDELLATHQKQLSQLQNQDVAGFDLAFAKLMVNAHEEALSLFRIASTNENEVYDTNVQEFAKATLPVIESHLIEAREILEQVDGM